MRYCGSVDFLALRAHPAKTVYNNPHVECILQIRRRRSLCVGEANKVVCYLPSLNVFGGIWRSFGGAAYSKCVIVYESRVRWRSSRQHNHNDALVSRSRRTDDVPGMRFFLQPVLSGSLSS